MTETTVIRKACWVVAWDEEAGEHRYLRHADVAFTGNEIVHVGASYGGEATNEIDGARLCVMPGLVNIHAHASREPFNKGLGDSGSGQLGEIQWFNSLIAFRPLKEQQSTVAEVGLSELLLSGVTTLVDVASPYPGWFELTERSGLRIYLAPMYNSAVWRAKGAYDLTYDWADDGGEADFREALDLVDRASRHDSGRMAGMVMPARIDTCTEELLQKSALAARERGMRLQIHAAQLVVEFQELARRHGATPIQYLDRIGLLNGGSPNMSRKVDWRRVSSWTRDSRRLARKASAASSIPAIRFCSARGGRGIWRRATSFG